MINSLDHPLIDFVISLPVFWIAAQIGAWFRNKQGDLRDDVQSDFTMLVGASLTLLGLIIGFTFSMALSRYDQRKNLEEEEANAIGTEYVRASLLPSAEAAKVQALLKQYLVQRILIYAPSDDSQVRQIDAQTAQLQTELWSAVADTPRTQPTAVAILILAGMNDVLNSQGYTHAAWRNRIPISAWALIIAISIFCNMLVGYGAHQRSTSLFLILPVALSISLLLIADIESPRRGIIHVRPQNLESLSESLQSQ